MKVDILFGIALSLTKKTCVNAKWLAQAFCISTRTVYRYISVLDTYIPIISKNGKGGGFSLMQSLSINSIPLTVDEKMYLGRQLLNVAHTCNNITLQAKIKYYVTQILQVIDD